MKKNIAITSSTSSKSFSKPSSPLENLMLDELYHAVFYADIKNILILLERELKKTDSSASIILTKPEIYVALASRQSYESIRTLLQVVCQISDAKTPKLSDTQIELLLLACIKHNTPTVFIKLLDFFSETVRQFSVKKKLQIFQLSIAFKRQFFSEKIIAWNVLPLPQILWIAYKYEVSNSFMLLLWDTLGDAQEDALKKLILQEPALSFNQNNLPPAIAEKLKLQQLEGVSLNNLSSPSDFFHSFVEGNFSEKSLIELETDANSEELWADIIYLLHQTGINKFYEKIRDWVISSGNPTQRKFTKILKIFHSVFGHTVKGIDYFLEDNCKKTVGKISDYITIYYPISKKISSSPHVSQEEKKFLGNHNNDEKSIELIQEEPFDLLKQWVVYKIFDKINLEDNYKEKFLYRFYILQLIQSKKFVAEAKIEKNPHLDENIISININNLDSLLQQLGDEWYLISKNFGFTQKRIFNRHQHFFDELPRRVQQRIVEYFAEDDRHEQNLYQQFPAARVSCKVSERVLLQFALREIEKIQQALIHQNSWYIWFKERLTLPMIFSSGGIVASTVIFFKLIYFFSDKNKFDFTKTDTYKFCSKLGYWYCLPPAKNKQIAECSIFCEEYRNLESEPYTTGQILCLAAFMLLMIVSWCACIGSTYNNYYSPKQSSVINALVSQLYADLEKIGLSRPRTIPKNNKQLLSLLRGYKTEIQSKIDKSKLPTNEEKQQVFEIEEDTDPQPTALRTMVNPQSFFVKPIQTSENSPSCWSRVKNWKFPWFSVTESSRSNNRDEQKVNDAILSSSDPRSCV